MLRPVVIRLAVAVLALAGLAACGSAPAAPDAATTPSSDGVEWVELDDSAVSLEGLDLSENDSLIGRAAPVPMSQAEARTRLPFEYQLPTWAPDGFTLQDEVEVVEPQSETGYASVMFVWLDPEQSAIYLQVSSSAVGQPRLGEAGDEQAVTINGQPAELVTSSGIGPQRVTLTWVRAGLTYSLSSDGGAASPEDLLRMAESIPA